MGEKHSGGGGGGIFFFFSKCGGKDPLVSRFSSSPLLSSICPGSNSLLSKHHPLRSWQPHRGTRDPAKSRGEFPSLPRAERGEKYGGGGGVGEEKWRREWKRGEAIHHESSFFPLLFFEVVSEDWWTEERWRGRGLSENPVAPWLCVLFLQVTIQSLWSQFCWLFEIISCHSTEKVPGIRQIINSFIISRPHHFHVRYVIFYTTVMQWMLRILHLIYLT